MKNIEKYKGNRPLTEQELEEITQHLIQSKFDEDKKSKWAKKLAQEHKVTRNSNRRFLNVPFRVVAIAASVLLLIALIPVLGLFQDSTTDLLAEYTIENPYPNKLIRKSTEASVSEIRLEATEAYVAENYKVAIEKYQQLQSNSTANLEDLLYLGLSQLYEQQTLMAVKTLENAQKQSQIEQRFEQEIDWFLALTYLQNEEKSKAKQLLQKIIAQKQWRITDAEKILKTI